MTRHGKVKGSMGASSDEGARVRSSTIRNRIKELRHVAADHLVPNPKNWRTHPKSQTTALHAILGEIGIADACIARELPDGRLMLIDGHLRAEVMSDEIVPVLVLDVSEEESDKLLAILDPITMMARQDTDTLGRLLQDLKAADDELTELVWPDYIRDPLTAANWIPPEDDNSDPYEAPNKTRTPPSSSVGSSDPEHVVTFTELQWEVVTSTYERDKKNSQSIAEYLVMRCEGK